MFGVGRFGGNSEHFNVWVAFTDVGTGNSLSGSKVNPPLPRGKDDDVMRERNSLVYVSWAIIPPTPG